jgi:DnaJ-class molecular chaperone
MIFKINIPCPDCEGSGEIYQTTDLSSSLFHDCWSCEGTGEITLTDGILENVADGFNEYPDATKIEEVL